MLPHSQGLGRGHSQGPGGFPRQLRLLGRVLHSATDSTALLSRPLPVLGNLVPCRKPPSNAHYGGRCSLLMTGCFLPLLQGSTGGARALWAPGHCEHSRVTAPRPLTHGEHPTTHTDTRRDTHPCTPHTQPALLCHRCLVGLLTCPQVDAIGEEPHPSDLGVRDDPTLPLACQYTLALITVAFAGARENPASLPPPSIVQQLRSAKRCLGHWVHKGQRGAAHTPAWEAGAGTSRAVSLLVPSVVTGPCPGWATSAPGG